MLGKSGHPTLRPGGSHVYRRELIGRSACPVLRGNHYGVNVRLPPAKKKTLAGARRWAWCPIDVLLL